MISAQNHRQPLSGNSLKYRLILFIAFLSLSSIATQVVEAQNGKSLTVAIIFPFFTDVDSTSLSMQNRQIQRAAYDYYEGLLLASDSLSQLGININLHVFDSEKRGEKVSVILAKLDEIKPDFVIGPAVRDMLQHIAPWSRERKVPVITPFIFLDSKDTIQLYGYYTNGTSRAATVKFVNNLILQGSNEVILLNDESEFSKEIIIALKKNLPDSNKVKILRWQAVAELAPKAGYQRILLLPTENVQVANAAVKLIKPNPDTARIIAIGQWQRFNSADYNSWNDRRIYWLNTYSPWADSIAYPPLKEQLYNRLNSEVTSHAIRGFADMFFFAQARITFGAVFPAMIENCSFSSSAGNYHFIRSGNSWENAGYRVLQFNEYRFIADNTFRE